MLEHAAALLLNLLPARSANDANPLSCNSQSESQGLQQPRRHRLRISRRGCTVCRRGRAQSQQSGFFLGFKMRTNISKKPLLCVFDWVSRGLATNRSSRLYMFEPTSQTLCPALGELGQRSEDLRCSKTELAGPCKNPSQALQGATRSTAAHL